LEVGQVPLNETVVARVEGESDNGLTHRAS
jgi:hypothetical protein